MAQFGRRAPILSAAEDDAGSGGTSQIVDGGFRTACRGFGTGVGERGGRPTVSSGGAREPAERL